jgi:hypothetical protein
LVALISFPGLAWAYSATAFIQSLVYAVMLTRLLPGIADAKTGAGSWPILVASAILLCVALIGCTVARDASDTLLERVLIMGSIAVAATGIFGALLWRSGDTGLTAMGAIVVRGLRQLRRPKS